MRQQPGIDTGGVGVSAANESGWFTPELAERIGDLAFVVNKVGPCESCIETFYFEVYNHMIDGCHVFNYGIRQ
jgi:hypothetical protein